MKNQAFSSILALIFTFSIYSQNKDESIFTEKNKIELGATPPESILKIALSFLETPYVASTLEINETEQLVCNLQELDCFTFDENVLALYLTKKANSSSYSDFQDLLTQLRYRNNKIEGYASRLHYFTEWVREAEKNGFIKDVTVEIGGEIISKEVHFMSENPKLYPKISDKKTLETIITYENKINRKPLSQIAKTKVAAIESQIREGDFIAMTSTIKNMDCNHVGVAILQNGRIHLLHASSSLKKVVISEKPLADYLQGNKKDAGIMVLRVL
ncbi:MAG TPA: N-acetylmuramoyl-L-alanine amidase-like domain-containing protein [Flavobacterium sp.]|nr:N-acetylmuramoyl-L-alanine amidase-like domain-containing protein [Flavobacterium sp.]